MTEAERLVADYAGMGLTVGRHPMALRRDELAMRGVLRATRSARARGRAAASASPAWSSRGSARAPRKGSSSSRSRTKPASPTSSSGPICSRAIALVIVEEPFLIVDGVLQNQDGVTSIRAEQVQGMNGVDVDFDAHDFY